MGIYIGSKQIAGAGSVADPSTAILNYNVANTEIGKLLVTDSGNKINKNSAFSLTLGGAIEVNGAYYSGLILPITGQYLSSSSVSIGEMQLGKILQYTSGSIVPSIFIDLNPSDYKGIVTTIITPGNLNIPKDNIDGDYTRFFAQGYDDISATTGYMVYCILACNGFWLINRQAYE